MDKKKIIRHTCAKCKRKRDKQQMKPYSPFGNIIPSGRGIRWQCVKCPVKKQY